jgi:hypothetical protein
VRKRDREREGEGGRERERVNESIPQKIHTNWPEKLLTFLKLNWTVFVMNTMSMKGTFSWKYVHHYYL